MTAATPAAGRPLSTGSPMRPQLRRFLAISGFTLFASIVVSVFLMPLVYMGATAFKSESQTSSPDAPIWPAAPETFASQGEEYSVFRVPTVEGEKSDIV